MWYFRKRNGKQPDALGICVLGLLVGITALGYPLLRNFKVGDVVSVWQVWYFAWLTAISTGFGVVPFFFSKETPKDVYLGLSNALAAGMMVSASLGLIVEGVDTNDIPGFYGYKAFWRVGMGFVVGVVFIRKTKDLMDHHEFEFKAHNVREIQKVILIILVMTLHSISEGIGIGVSFGGKSGSQLGQFISLSLGLHNIPEGLAVALVMRTRGATNLRTVIWCVCTSLPQPLMAIPAFLFIEHFKPTLAVGLGFAAGAMVYVALFELVTEAVEQCGRARTVATSTVAFFLMLYAQYAVKGNMNIIEGGSEL